MIIWHDGNQPLAMISSVIAALILLGGCERESSRMASNDGLASPPQATVPLAEAASAPTQSSQLRYSLGIVGYNYTETGIIDYSVNGTGAFNLAVSTEDSGGGKTVCCFGWVPGMKLPMPIQIEWTRDEETWCRRTVMLTAAGPLEPTTFEVHFFPDRHIEVAITDAYSPPRIKLTRAGRDFRVAKDVHQEKQDSMRKDSIAGECREGRFPIGVRAEQQDRERKAKP